MPDEQWSERENLIERLGHFAEELPYSPELSRRALLGIGTLGALDVSVAVMKARANHAHRTAQTVSRGLQAWRNRATPTTTSTSTTTTSTTAPPPPLALPETQYRAAEADLGEISPELKMERIQGLVGFMPGLQELAAQHPSTPYFQDIPGKMALLERINRETSVSADEYYHTIVDESRVGVFRGHPDYGKRITPRLTVVHWTAEFPPGGLDQLIEGMKKAKRNYHYVVDKIIDGRAQTYRLFDEDFPRQGAHAFRANQLGRGISIMAARLEDIHPLHVKEVVKTIVRDHRMNQLPIDHTTVVSHFATDLILDNPTFDPATRRAGTIGKFDVPQELMNIVVEKAKTLDLSLGPRP